MVGISVQQLLKLEPTARRIVVTQGDDIQAQGQISLIDQRGPKLWIEINHGGYLPRIVYFLATDCTISVLTGGEIHIQEGNCQATIYPA